MKEQIQEYVAPDLSSMQRESPVTIERFDTRDIKNDLKKDISRIERQVDSVEQRGKDAFALVRESIDSNDAKGTQDGF